MYTASHTGHTVEEPNAFITIDVCIQWYTADKDRSIPHLRDGPIF